MTKGARRAAPRDLYSAYGYYRGRFATCGDAGGTTEDGAPCKGAPVQGSSRCWHHRLQDRSSSRTLQGQPPADSPGLADEPAGTLAADLSHLLRVLSQRELEVLDRRHGGPQPETYDSLAARFRLSPGRLRNIHLGAVSKLGRVFADEPLPRVRDAVLYAGGAAEHPIVLRDAVESRAVANLPDEGFRLLLILRALAARCPDFHLDVQASRAAVEPRLEVKR
jgi:hypothetical protein